MEQKINLNQSLPVNAIAPVLRPNSICFKEWTVEKLVHSNKILSLIILAILHNYKERTKVHNLSQIHESVNLCY